jgi:HEPN domain-containing protein
LPLDRARVAEARAWLVKASADILAAELDFGADPLLLGDAAFHCQQAVEKTIKAFLSWHDVPFRKTHDLVELSAQCLEIDPSLEATLRSASYLTEYGWRFRYPGEPQVLGRSEVQDAISGARRAHADIVSRLPDETHPKRTAKG